MLLLIALNQWLMAWRFRLVMQQCTSTDMSNVAWLRLTSVGQFLNLFVPQFGHVYRAYVLKQQVGLTYADYAMGLAVFFWFEVLTGLVLATAVVALQDSAFRVGGLMVLPILAFGTLALLLAPLAFAWFVELARRGAVGLSKRFHSTGASIARAATALRNPSFVARFSGISLLVAAGHVGMLWLAFDAVGGSPSLGRLMLFQVLLKLSNILLLTPGNLGLTELAYGLLAEATASGLQQGIAAALVVRAVGTVVMVLMGVTLGALPLLRARRRGTAHAARN